jgi:methyl-accepting chemotaxis protein
MTAILDRDLYPDPPAPKPKGLRLRERLLMTVLPLSLLPLAIAGGISWHVTNEREFQEADVNIWNHGMLAADLVDGLADRNSSFDELWRPLEHVGINGSERVQIIDLTNKKVLTTITSTGPAPQADILGGELILQKISALQAELKAKQPPQKLPQGKKDSYIATRENLQGLKIIPFVHGEGDYVLSTVFSSNGKNYAIAFVPGRNWASVTSVDRSEIAAIASQQGNFFGLIALLLGGIVTVITIVLARQLSSPLRALTATAEEFTAGNLTARATARGTQEMQTLAETLNSLAAKIANNEETIRQEVARLTATDVELKRSEEEKAESDALQNDIEQLLDTVSAIEEGNLTVQAPVSDRVTGLVSDTLNRLIEELARIMATVSMTAEEVTDSAIGLEQLALQSSQQAKQQTEAVDRIKALVQDVTELTEDNSNQTGEANVAMQQAQKAVGMGQGQMKALNGEIKSLEHGTNQITRRVQTLSEFVQLAVQFVKTQKRTASITRVLALNASLLSSRAIEQQDPDQFASIVSEFATITSQVNDLANQTNQDLVILQQRTDQIQTVVSGLSQDVREINQVVRVFTTGVDGSNQVFGNIQDATNRVVQVGQRVAESSQVIAQASHTTLSSVEDIATLAMATEQRANIIREQSGVMGQLSRDLLQLVSFFQIPSEQMQVSQRSFDSIKAERTGMFNRPIEPTLSETR